MDLTFPHSHLGTDFAGPECRGRGCGRRFASQYRVEAWRSRVGRKDGIPQKSRRARSSLSPAAAAGYAQRGRRSLGRRSSAGARRACRQGDAARGCAGRRQAGGSCCYASARTLSRGAQASRACARGTDRAQARRLLSRQYRWRVGRPLARGGRRVRPFRQGRCRRACADASDPRIDQRQV